MVLPCQWQQVPVPAVSHAALPIQQTTEWFLFLSVDLKAYIFALSCIISILTINILVHYRERGIFH